MALPTVTRGERPLQASSDSNGRTITERYKISAETRLTTVQVYDLQADNGTISSESTHDIPVRSDPHPDDDGLLADKIKLDDKDAGRHWWVDVTYKSFTATFGLRGDQDDPIKQPPIIRFRTAPLTKLVTKSYKEDDAQGKPTEEIQNSAEDPYVYTQQVSGEIIEVIRNERIYGADNKALYRDTLNKVEVGIAGRTIPALHGIIVRVDGDPKYDNDGDLYWAVTYHIFHTAETQIVELFDEGFYFIDGITGNKGVIREADINESVTKTSKFNTTVKSAKKLNGNGDILLQSLAGVFNEFTTYFPAEWEALEFPATEEEFAAL